jgi:hypothetical protein
MRQDILKEAYDREGKKRKREERRKKKLRYGKGKFSVSAEVEMGEWGQR